MSCDIGFDFDSVVGGTLSNFKGLCAYACPIGYNFDTTPWVSTAFYNCGTDGCEDSFNCLEGRNIGFYNAHMENIKKRGFIIGRRFYTPFICGLEASGIAGAGDAGGRAIIKIDDNFDSRITIAATTIYTDAHTDFPIFNVVDAKKNRIAIIGSDLNGTTGIENSGATNIAGYSGASVNSFLIGSRTETVPWVNPDSTTTVITIKCVNTLLTSADIRTIPITRVAVEDVLNGQIITLANIGNYKITIGTKEIPSGGCVKAVVVNNQLQMLSQT
jgi:hypothetical protein